MSLGNGNPKEGDKGSNFNYELKVLQGLESIAVAIENGASITDVTYSELRSMMTAASLKVNALYRITDFANYYSVPMFNYDLQPLFIGATTGSGSNNFIVRAISNSLLDIYAHDLNRPTYIIKYDPYVETTEAGELQCTGRIIYLEDPNLNIKGSYDWQTVLFHRVRNIVPNFDSEILIGGTSYTIDCSTSTLTTPDGNFNSLSPGDIITVKADDNTFYNVKIGSINNTYECSIVSDNSSFTFTGTRLYYTVYNGDISSYETYIGQYVSEGYIATYNTFTLGPNTQHIDLGKSYVITDGNPFYLPNNILGINNIVYDVTVADDAIGNTFGSCAVTTVGSNVSFNYAQAISASTFSGSITKNYFGGGISTTTLSGAIQQCVISYNTNIQDSTLSGSILNSFFNDVINSTLSGQISYCKFDLIRSTTIQDSEVSYIGISSDRYTIKYCNILNSKINNLASIKGLEYTSIVGSESRDLTVNGLVSCNITGITAGLTGDYSSALKIADNTISKTIYFENTTPYIAYMSSGTLITNLMSV